MTILGTASVQSVPLENPLAEIQGLGLQNANVAKNAQKPQKKAKRDSTSPHFRLMKIRRW
jgi:hypothetical protein